MKIGLLPLGRSTFDVAYAEEKLSAMISALTAIDLDLTGPTDLLMDMDAGRKAITDLSDQGIDHVIVLQVTFTDAALIVEAQHKFDCPLSIWAIPEPRIGGRLRLNSYCGLNLASHALSLNKAPFNWLYADPAVASKDDLLGLVQKTPAEKRPITHKSEADPKTGQEVLGALAGKRIAKIGQHPDGFFTSAYSADKLESLAGITVDEIDLPEFFDEARSFDESEVIALKESVSHELDGLDDANQEELSKSLRLKLALDSLKKNKKVEAFAIRCWPETFTEYGGAVCGPVSMMGEGGTPCACEADTYGALTQMILQKCADAPVFLTDVVDVDPDDNTAVIWHCGQAPKSMCAESDTPNATIHTNRKMSLLYEFALKPGRVTVMRISQGFGETSMVLAGAEMLERPMAFTGTSGVLRFDRNAGDVLDDMIHAGLEHHVAIVYGDHREALKSTAAAMDLPVLEL